jgi:2-succinyl-6-hydroxy-2,4-cyclohexadiene-1-carboxylate synthase
MKLNCNNFGNSSGRPIIFLHGLFGSSKDFFFVKEKLGQDRFCQFWDLPGHGKSDSFSFSNFREFCDFFFNQLGNYEQKPDLVGYSLGGRVALDLITHYPDFFNQAVIISANPGIISDPERASRLKTDKILLEKISSKELFFKEWYQQSLFGNLFKHPDFDKLLNERLNCNFDRIEKCLEFLSIGSQVPLWDKLAKTNKSILYLCGELDNKYDDLGRLLSSNRSILSISVPKSGHNLIFENPEIFLNNLIKFFR